MQRKRAKTANQARQNLAWHYVAKVILCDVIGQGVLAGPVKERGVLPPSPFL